MDHRDYIYYRQMDRNSTTWVTSLPDKQGLLRADVFSEVAASYFLLPQPTLTTVVDYIMPGRQPNQGVVRCDAYGDALLAAGSDAGRGADEAP